MEEAIKIHLSEDDRELILKFQRCVQIAKMAFNNHSGGRGVDLMAVSPLAVKAFEVLYESKVVTAEKKAA